jgi:hypothetical protein
MSGIECLTWQIATQIITIEIYKNSNIKIFIETAVFYQKHSF